MVHMAFFIQITCNPKRQTKLQFDIFNFSFPHLPTPENKKFPENCIKLQFLLFFQSEVQRLQIQNFM